ncbi:MAG: cytochrome c biogenesis protein [Acidobacteriia bacterium]|nr:cytochrome c biogenesis protein [Terriglobia bacterium]
MYIILSWIAILSYLITEVLYGLNLLERKPAFAKLASRFLVLSMAIHFGAMLARSRQFRVVPYNDLYGSLSLFAWMVAIIYLALEFRHRQKSVGAFLLPIPVILLILATLLNRTERYTPPAELRGALFAYHVTSNIFAYSAFTVSFILSAMYLLQHHQIRIRRSGLLFSRLPSLELLERMNRTSVAIGVPVLVCGILLGSLWARKLHVHWALDPKLVWSLITLLVYAGYLFLEKQGTWKGKRSAIISVCGFLIIIFSYSVVNLFFSSFHKFY